jgi:hypothetical protein
MMNRGKLVVGIALTAALALPLAACGGKGRVSSAKMCAAHGGTYNASTQTCSYTASTKSAKEICAAQGGYYDPGAQYCEIGQD